jgi:Right handed beta helix region
MTINIKTALRTVAGIKLPVLVFLLAANMLQARTMYLATDGDDSADCVAGAEFKTLARALSCLTAGDTLIIREGAYTSGLIVKLEGTAEAPIVIKGESLEAVIDTSYRESRDNLRLDNSSHVVLENLTVRRSSRAGLGIINCHHITVRGCVFADNYKWGIFTGFADDVHFEDNECYGAKDEHGIYHSNSGDRFVIRGNRIHNNAGCGIHINGDPEMGGDGVNSYGLVEDNIIYLNGTPKGGAGINMTHVQDVLVRNNLLYKNYAGGFTFYQDTGDFSQGSKRGVIMGNTVYFEVYGRNCVNIAPTSEKAVVVGNILVSRKIDSNLQVESEHLSTIVSDYNNLWGVDSFEVVERDGKTMSLADWRSLTGNDMHSVVDDPFFVDLESDDYTLTDSSAAVDMGIPRDSLEAILEGLGGFEWHLALLDSIPDRDILGYARPAGAGPDAGAYELGGSPTGFYDFNRDGELGLADAIELILRGFSAPEDRALDVNKDGKYTIADVIQLLIMMRQS